MDKLCAKQLIERISSKENRRVVNIIITEIGLKLILKIDDQWQTKLLFNKIKIRERTTKQFIR